MVYVDLRGSAARGAGAWAILAVYVLLCKGKAPGDAGERPRVDPSIHGQDPPRERGSRILLFIFVPEFERQSAKIRLLLKASDDARPTSKPPQT